MLIDLKHVKKITSLSKSTIYRLMQSGDFPKKYKLTSSSTRWKLSEIEEWIESKALKN